MKNIQMHFITLTFNDPQMEREFRKYHNTKTIPYERIFLWVLLVVALIWFFISSYLGIENIDEQIVVNLKRTLLVLMCLSVFSICFSYTSLVMDNLQIGTCVVCLLIGSLLLYFFETLPYSEFISYSYGIVVLFIFAFLTLAVMNVVLSFLVSILLIGVYTFILFHKINILNLNTLIPILYVLTSFIFGLVGAYAFEKRAREEFISTKIIEQNNSLMEGLSAKLSKYLSPNLYNSIFTGQKEVRVESARKKLTIFFSDIKGFTELTDSIESETLTLILNSYLNEMAEIALEYGGTIDKFIGDAILIFFGDPQTKGEDEDSIQCVFMAIKMQEAIRRLNDKWRKMGAVKDIQVRIGIHSGFCTVGNFGSENRLEYTIIGGSVNLAKRLESASQEGKILISEDTYALVKEKIHCVKKDRIHVKGISYPVQTYEVAAPVEKIEKNEITENFWGFSLHINYHTVDKKKAKAILNNALKSLNKKNDFFNWL
ncbi:MAG: adenylate cyclase [Desulfobacterales bacterium]|nr:adenylate cyclase [Desulfobacterales bacterium]